MKALIFGTTGQVGLALARSVPAGWQVEALGRDKADLTDPAACAALVASSDAEVVINAAAYTAVDKAEEDEGTAQLVNGDTPASMARAAAARDLPFLHVSTDYVFDGQGTRPWSPSDPTGPLGAYGRTKRAGEAGVIAAGGPHVILRTSWVFSADGANFLKTMLRLSETRDALTVVGDQIGGPTPAAAIADALWRIAAKLKADPGLSGVYHFSGAPDVSWADFAREIFAQADRPVAVTDIPTSDYPTPAVRPPNSRMDCTMTEQAFGIARPDWRAGVTACLAALAHP